MSVESLYENPAALGAVRFQNTLVGSKQQQNRPSSSLYCLPKPPTNTNFNPVVTEQVNNNYLPKKQSYGLNWKTSAIVFAIFVMVLLATLLIIESVGMANKGDSNFIQPSDTPTSPNASALSSADKAETNCNQVSRADIEEIKQMLMEMQRNFTNQIASNNENVVDTTTNSTTIRNCDDVYNSGSRTDGVFYVFTGYRFVQVYCDFQNGGYNWMVFQRRINGEVDFYRDWTSYANGFGNRTGEFWLGLEPLHEITNSKRYALRVDLEDWEGNKRYAEYSYFDVGDSIGNYTLHVRGYSGTAGDGLTHHNNYQYTTKDRNNDDDINNCAIHWQGAWWYVACYESNLNGLYRKVGPGDWSGLSWLPWRGSYSMKHTSMKVRLF